MPRSRRWPKFRKRLCSRRKPLNSQWRRDAGIHAPGTGLTGQSVIPDPCNPISNKHSLRLRRRVPMRRWPLAGRPSAGRFPQRLRLLQVLQVRSPRCNHPESRQPESPPVNFPVQLQKEADPNQWKAQLEISLMPALQDRSNHRKPGSHASRPCANRDASGKRTTAFRNSGSATRISPCRALGPLSQIRTGEWTVIFMMCNVENACRIADCKRPKPDLANSGKRPFGGAVPQRGVDQVSWIECTPWLTPSTLAP